MKTRFTLLALSALALLQGCEQADDEPSGTGNTNAPVTLIYQATGLSATEPERGSAKYILDFSLSRAADRDVSFDIDISSGTADVKDFVAKKETVTFTKGALSMDVPIELKGDDFDEPDETILVTLSNPVGLTLSNGTTYNVVVRDNDPTPSISFETNFAQVTEGVGDYTVKVMMSNPSQEEVKFDFSVSGLATEHQDFIMKTQSPLIIASGETQQEITIEFLSDDLPEGGESLNLLLKEPLNGVLGSHKSLALFIPGDISMNDTGVVSWYDGQGFNDTAQNSAYPNQDAEFGRDTHNNVDYDGKNGFSLQKLDFAGNALPSNATNFSCVRDNTTGLVWEVKRPSHSGLPTETGKALKDKIQKVVGKAKLSPEHPEYEPYPWGELHENWQANNYQYYWFDDNASTNGGSTGAQGALFVDKQYPLDNICAFPYIDQSNYTGLSTHCNTAEYAESFNALAICGFKNWRLPTIEELRGIHDFDSSSQPVNDFFPQVNTNGRYLSSSPSADGDGVVWCFEPKKGEVKYCNKQTPNLIRLVRKEE